MKKLNIKSMAKSMGLKERAKLILADCNLKYDTRGEKSLLGPGEEDALADACRNDGNISELNHVIDIFNAVRLVVGDVEMGMLRLSLAVANLDKYVLFSFQDEERLKKIKEYGFSLFDGDSMKPNIFVQKLYSRVVAAYKRLRQCLHVITYAENLADMPLVSDGDNLIVEEAKKELVSVESLDGFLSVIKMYRSFMEAGEFKASDVEELVFASLLKGDDVFVLNEEEEKEAKEKLNRFLKRGGTPFT